MPTGITEILGQVDLRPATAFAVAVFVAYLVTFPVRILGQRLKILDLPGHRSSHSILAELGQSEGSRRRRARSCRPCRPILSHSWAFMLSTSALMVLGNSLVSTRTMPR